MITKKVSRKMRRIMRLLDWLNTGIDGKGKFHQNYNAKHLLHLFDLKFMKDFLPMLKCPHYAVFVRNLRRRGNSSSIVRISSMLTPVHASILNKNSRKLPNWSHSKKRR